jgi:hypothetical protein
MILSVAVMALTGCGGGGDSAPTVVSGVASKGEFTSGSVSIFRVDPVTFAKGAALAENVALQAGGAYEANIGSYTGPIVIEAVGTYTDEATGIPVTITTPIRSAIAGASGNVTAMVTPLTEMAVIKMAGKFDKATIDQSNGMIATAFTLTDITKTKPVSAITAAAASASEAEKKQSLVLAAISQMVANTQGSTLDSELNFLAGTISANGLSDAGAAAYKTGLFDFNNESTTNQLKNDAAVAQINVGAIKIAHMRLSTAGVAAGAKIGGLDLTLTLPLGITLPTLAGSAEVEGGVIKVAGDAALAGTTLTLSTLNGAILKTVVVNSNGFDSGSFLDVSCIIPSNAGVTDLEAIAALEGAILTATVEATEINTTTGTTAPIPGATVTAAGAVTVF